MTGGRLAEGLYEVPPGFLAEVVTSLEMRERPAARVPAGRSDVELRREHRPGLDWYRGLFRSVGGPWLWTSRLLLDDAALSAIVHDPAVAVFAVEHEGAEIGVLELDFRIQGECEIAFFGLLAEAAGQGIGRWLMDQALAQAWSRPITRLWVHTCTLDHPAALPFYLRSGFVPFRREVGIVSDPRHAGLLPAGSAPRIPLL